MFIYYKGDDTELPALARPTRRRWHAVGIVAAAEACAAAKACRDNRFLSLDAPRLPLAGCDASCCDCRYAHFEDRRGGARRAAEKAGAPPKRVSLNQRARTGRRATDFNSD